MILDGAQKKERFVDYYFELYDRENLVPEEALNVIKCLPVLEELDIEPTEEEVKRPWVHLLLEKRPVRTIFQLKS